MEILFLGTCAFDFSPKLTEEYRDCLDKDARRASCALLDGHLLVDCGPHCLDSFRLTGRDMGAVTDIFITHLHPDHFNADSVCSIAASTPHGVRLWVREDAPIPAIPHVTVMPMKSGTPYAVSEDCTVVGLPANHAAQMCPQWLFFTLGGQTLLYALDGAWFCNETFQYLRGRGLNAAVMDATVGDTVGDYRMAEHNSIPMIRLMLPSLKTAGIFNENTALFLSHIAPSLHRPHAETEPIVRQLGAVLAYDGLSVEIE